MKTTGCHSEIAVVYRKTNEWNWNSIIQTRHSYQHLRGAQLYFENKWLRLLVLEFMTCSRARFLLSVHSQTTLCSLLTSLKIICGGCLTLVLSWTTSIDCVLFFLPPLLSSLNRSQLSSLPQHSKLVSFLTYCIFPHTCSLLSLTPAPIPLLQSWQTSQAYKLVASGTPRMQQRPSTGCELPATPLRCRCTGLHGFMDSWAAQLHLLCISLVIYDFTLHLTKNAALK